MIGPLAYIGGKNRLASHIIPLIPEHTTYVEPFAGGAQVFFHKKPSQIEILNDLSHNIVNFFRVCQLHHEELIRYLKFMLISRKWYQLLEKSPPETLTDVQRAARFLYLQKTSYGGLVVRRNFTLRIVQEPNLNTDSLPELIRKAHQRLQHAQVDCLPYEKIIEKCDRPTTFFYLDPPYWDRKLYEFNFSRDDFLRMARLLAHIKGKFILSINDVPEIRKIFSRFKIRRLDLAYSSQKSAGRRYSELLISNCW